MNMTESNIMKMMDDLKQYRELGSVKELTEKINEEDVLKFYYCESEDDYYVGRRVDIMHYSTVNPKTFDLTFCMSRYLPWGEYVAREDTSWKEHTYPSEPKEISFSEWLKGWIGKHIN